MNGAEGEASGNQAEASAWRDRSASDVRAAELCIDAKPPLLDIASYHCQQAAEKLLKGLLVLAGVEAPRTHDLIRLADLAAAAFPQIAELAHATEGWTVWNTAYRYPAEEEAEPLPTPDDLRRALATISKLSEALRAL